MHARVRANLRGGLVTDKTPASGQFVDRDFGEAPHRVEVGADGSLGKVSHDDPRDNMFEYYDKALGPGQSHEIWTEHYNHARKIFRELRSTKENSGDHVAYTQGQHDAIREMFCGTFAQFYLLFIVHTAKREALEARVAALEARPALKWAGVWKGDVPYKENSLITHSGGLWLATIESKGCRPGDGAIWRLIVKKGGA